MNSVPCSMTSMLKTLYYAHKNKNSPSVTGLEPTSLLVPNEEKSLSTKKFVFVFLLCGSLTIPLLLFYIHWELFNIFNILIVSMVQVPCMYTRVFHWGQNPQLALNLERIIHGQRECYSLRTWPHSDFNQVCFQVLNGLVALKVFWTLSKIGVLQIYI